MNWTGGPVGGWGWGGCNKRNWWYFLSCVFRRRSDRKRSQVMIWRKGHIENNIYHCSNSENKQMRHWINNILTKWNWLDIHETEDANEYRLGTVIQQRGKQVWLKRLENDFDLKINSLYSNQYAALLFTRWNASSWNQSILFISMYLIVIQHILTKSNR